MNILKTLVFIALISILTSCNFGGHDSDVCHLWPPKDSVGILLPKTSTDTLSYDYNFTSSGWHGMNSYGQLVDPYDKKDVISFMGAKPDSAKIENECFKIAGHFSSQLGSVIVKARYTKWAKLYDSKGNYTHEWGAIMDSGQIIMEKQELIKISNSFIYKNNYKIEEINTKYILIRIQENSQDNIILVHGYYDNHRPYFKPIINSVGTIAITKNCNFEVKSDGWYSKNYKIPIKNPK